MAAEGLIPELALPRQGCRVWFVRHGESMGNLTGDYSTDQADSLSPRGWQQAHAVGEWIGRLKPSRVLVSPLTRALQTIYPWTKGGLFRKAHVWPLLAEGCWQDDARSGPDTFRLGEAAWTSGLRKNRFRLDNQGFRCPPGDETWAEGMARFRKAVGDLRDEFHGNDRDVVVVSHGFAISRMLELLSGQEPVGRYDMDNTAVCLHAPLHETALPLLVNHRVHGVY